jgi:hypothetical protein
MDQFNDGAQADRAVSPVPRIPRRKEQQSWPEALAATTQKVARDLRHRLDRRVVLERKLLLDLDEVVANKIEYFLRRQK